MHVILQHCYFKAPLVHYKTLLVHDSSIGSSESLSDRMSSIKIEFKMSFDWFWYSSVFTKHPRIKIEFKMSFDWFWYSSVFTKHPRTCLGGFYWRKPKRSLAFRNVKCEFVELWKIRVALMHVNLTSVNLVSGVNFLLVVNVHS